MLTGSPTNLDLNMLRAIEELAHVIREVDLRVQQVKLGLSQTFPQVGLGLDRSAFPHFGPGLVSPYLAAPTSWPTRGIVPYGNTFGINPILGATPGVSAPFVPLGNPFSPFRG